jgi:beta-1,4-mannosyl-glycoprotein beta-1,4-N-acetylglucosaminyltransferase
MKIFDCFIYFDEDILLDLRLNILDKVVDKFIIIESSTTHTGLKRKLKFNINKYKRFKNKIYYFSLENLIIDKNVKLKKNWSKHHLIDQAIRNHINNCIDEANDDDWIIVSDIDEIPKPNKIKEFNKKKKYAFFEQDLYCYKFNLKNLSEPHWYGSRICVKKYLKSPQWLRNIKIQKKQNFIKKLFFNYQIIKDGGWHFTSLKKPEDLIIKLKSFAHNELVKQYMLDVNYISNKIKNFQDLFGRNIVLKKTELDKYLENFLLKDKEKYKDFIL